MILTQEVKINYLHALEKMEGNILEHILNLNVDVQFIERWVFKYEGCN